MLESRELLEIKNSKLRVERWVDSLEPLLETRQELMAGLAQGAFKLEDDIARFNNGLRVPCDLIPIISLWARRGPAILCSYSHPEEFNLYTIIAQLNLVHLIDRLKIRGVIIGREQVAENWSETVALGENVIRPLNFGGIVPLDKLKADVFGIAGHKFGLVALDLDRHQELVSLTEEKIPELARVLEERFTQELDDALKEKSPGLTRRERFEARQEGIRGLITRRLFTVTRMVGDSGLAINRRPELRVNNLLFEVQQRFWGYILDERDDIFPRKLHEVTGIDGKLSSDNIGYLDLVTETLRLLTEARGVSVLKGLVGSTGEGLFLGCLDGQNVTLTVDKDTGDFLVMMTKTGEIKQSISDTEVLDFVGQNNFIPLAKAEMLALISGGVTLHMGSEYNSREKTLAVLGLEDNKFSGFRDYLGGLRIGTDLEQGSEPFLLGGTKGMPALLAFVLFGRNILRQMIFDQVGSDCGPKHMIDREIKKLVAEKLVEGLE